MKNTKSTILALTVMSILAGQAHAQATQERRVQADTTSSASKQRTNASRHVSDAIAVVRKLEAEEGAQGLLKGARGVFISPSYGRAALGLGAAGGTGILLVHRADGSWSDPVFYNTGGLSLGLQAGAQGGALVLVLNNEKALNEFFKKNNFSLNAKAGLTVVNWNKAVQGSAGDGDVLAWSDTKGLFGDLATVEVNDIRFSQSLTNAYYNRSLSASDIVQGRTNNPQAQPLVDALAAVTQPAQ